MSGGEESRFRDWCDQVAGYVRFRPDREAVKEELEAHLEDKLVRLEAAGAAHEAAVEQAVAEMGDAEAVGKALDRVHQRWLGWLWLVSRVATCIGILVFSIALLGGFRDWNQELTLLPERQQDYEAEKPLFLSKPDDAYTRIALGGGVETAESCGYTMSVPYAALWQYPVKDSYAYVFSGVLEVKNDRFWDGTAKGIWEHLRLRDDTGRLFSDMTDAETADTSRMRAVQKLEGNRICTRYVIWVPLQEPPTEWMELEYPSTAGWTLRVEWEEKT